MTFYTGVEERKHHAENARVGIEPAHGDPFDSEPPQFLNILGRKAVGGFFDDQIARPRLDDQQRFSGSRRAGFFFSIRLNMEPGGLIYRVKIRQVKRFE